MTYTLSEIRNLLQNMHITDPIPRQHIPSATYVTDVLTSSTKEIRVPYAEYVHTTTAQSKNLEGIKLSNSGTANKKNFKNLKMLIDECRLLPLAEGTRLKPFGTLTNTFGYTPDRVIVDAEGSQILIPKDDLSKFNHDKERLFAILNASTNDDLHYLITSSLETKKVSLWYLALKDHIHGTTNTDIRKAKKALEDLRVTSAKTVKENIALVEEAIKVLNVASNIDMTDIDKLYYLQEKFIDDKRMSVQGFMATAKSEGLSYLDTVRRLILVDPSIVPVHKMAALSSEPELCQRHLRGVCTNGSSCKYSHKPQGPHETKTAGLPDKGKPHTPRPPGLRKLDEKFPLKPFIKKPVVVSDAHRARVGYPRGKPTTSNPDGFSIKQLSFIHHLQSEPQDNWAKGESYFSSRESVHQERFNMLRVQTDKPAPDSATSDITIRSALLPSRDEHRVIDYTNVDVQDYSKFSDEEDDADIDEIVEQMPANLLLQRKHLSIPPSQIQMLQQNATIIKLIQDYHLDHYDYTNRDPGEFLLMWLSNTPRSEGFVAADVVNLQYPLFTSFNWMSEFPHVHDGCYSRTDVLIGAPQLMQLIYQINAIYFNATMILPPNNSTADRFMTFDPVKGQYFAPTESGFYSSTMISLTSFWIALTGIAKSPFPQNVKDYLRLGLFFDLMSYCSNYYTQAIISGVTVQSHRRILRQGVHIFKKHKDFKSDKYLLEVIDCIIESIGPNPQASPELRRVPRKNTPLQIAQSSSTAAPDHYTDDRPRDPDLDRSPKGTPLKRRTSNASNVSRESFRTAHSHPRNKNPSNATPPRNMKRPSKPSNTSPRKESRTDPSSDLVVFAPEKSTSSSSSAMSPPKKSRNAPKQEYNVFKVNDNKKMLSMTMPPGHKTIIDSGASACGTGVMTQLKNLRGTSCTVSAAFGKTAQPTHMGDLPPFMLKTIVIDEMKDTTLLSVSQACQQGMCGIFTAKDCRFYTLKSVIPFLSQVSEYGEETMRGNVEDGLYIQESN